MKIERISENQIRCTLNNFDLSARNLNLSELAYGSEKAKNLFREMIQKASNEVGFEADDIPLMVEAIPLSNESVMLVITKMEDPEELDTRFAKFSPMSEDEDSLLNDLTSELLEGAEGLMQYLKGNAAEQENSAGIQNPQEAVPQTETKEDSLQTSSADNVRIFMFTSFDQICDASKAVEPSFDGKSRLYKNTATGPYYMLVKRVSDSGDCSRLCHVLAEYGTKIRHDYATEAYYEEHYEMIIRKDALQALSQL